MLLTYKIMENKYSNVNYRFVDAFDFVPFQDLVFSTYNNNNLAL